MPKHGTHGQSVAQDRMQKKLAQLIRQWAEEVRATHKECANASEMHRQTFYRIVAPDGRKLNRRHITLLEFLLLWEYLQPPIKNISELLDLLRDVNQQSD